MSAIGMELPVTTDLTLAAVQEVAASLVSPVRQLFLDRHDGMRMRAAGNIVSLAFRRALQQHGVPHEYVPPVSFTEPDRMEISIGGRRCVPVVQLVAQSVDHHAEEVTQSATPPVALLPAQRGAPIYRGVDVLVFIRLAARLTRSREALDRALVAGTEVFLVHAMPQAWSQPRSWTGLGRLAIKSDTSEDLDLTLYGQDGQRYSLTRALALPARRHTRLEEGFYALGGLHSNAIPSAPVGIYSPALDDLHLIHPYQWGNIWLDPRQITISGFITLSGFEQQAEWLPGRLASPANPCLEEIDCLAVPLATLTPIEDLFTRAREWAARSG